MIHSIKTCGFKQVIPWTDYPPGIIRSHRREGEQVCVADAKESFLDRVRNFVEHAHAEDLKVQLYFAVGPPVMAVIRTHEHGQKRLYVNELGVMCPDCASHDRLGRSSLDLACIGEGHTAFASIGYPEVRHWIAEWVVSTVANSGADGIQLEPLTPPLDDTGTCLLGYDEPILSDFKRRHGRDPLTLPNSDQTWVQHRAEYTTQIVCEIKERIARLGKPIELSIQCHNLATDTGRFFWPWRKWVKEKLVDTCYLKSSVPQGFYVRLVQGREWCETHGVRFASILDMKTYSEFPTPEAVANGVLTMLASGVVQVTIYGLAFTPLAPNPKEVPVDRWLNAREMLKNEL